MLVQSAFLCSDMRSQLYMLIGLGAASTGGGDHGFGIQNHAAVLSVYLQTQDVVVLKFQTYSWMDAS